MLDSHTPITSVEKIIWPAIPGGQGAVLLSLLHQFEQSQWWSPEKLLAHQLEQISALLSYSFSSIPFYREHLEKAGYTPGQKIDLSWLKQLPILTRQQLVDAGASITNHEPPKTHGKVAKGKTTGSSGRPLEYYGTQLTQLFWQAFSIRDHLWHQRNLAGKLGVIRIGLEEKEHENWGPPLNLVFKTGKSITLDIKTDIEEQVDWLLTHQPDYLLSFPSSIRALMVALKERGDGLQNLKQIRTISEAFSPELRTIVHDTTGAKLVDIYSTCETGYIALQCPEHDHYHIQSEGVLVEILDNDGKPCRPGETGRVIVTDLHNFAMPLIRYDLQDYATVGEPCSCGRGLPVITKINGRERNLIKLPEGKTYWPLIGYHKWMAVAPIKQIQVRQTSLQDVSVHLVMSRTLTSDEQKEFEVILADSLGYTFNISYNYVSEIASGSGGKYEDFICEL